MSSTLLPLLVGVLGVTTKLMDWLLTYAIHSTLLIGAVWLFLATRTGPGLSPTQTSWLWRFALVGGVASACLQSLRSPDPLAGTLRVGEAAGARQTVRISVDRSQLATMDTPGAVIAPLGAPLTWRKRDPRIREESLRTAGTLIRSMRVDVQPGWVLTGVAIWLLGVVLFVGAYLRARARFHRLLGERRNATFTLAGGALRAVRDRAAYSRPVVLTLSERLTSPVALGLDEICIPARALAELDPIRMESILAHELAHLERRDPVWLTIARVIEAVFFFQPLNRLARVRMQEAAEFASDGWAAGIVSRPLDLAHCLARVAEWTRGSSRLLAPAMAERRGTTLVRRVERLTSNAPPRIDAGNGRGLRLAAAVSVVGLVLLAPRASAGHSVQSDERARMYMIRLSDTVQVGAGAAGQRNDAHVLRFIERP